MKILAVMIGVLGLFLTSCSNSSDVVVEVTSFKLNSGVDYKDFNELDAEVESTFTSKQAGFLNRQSGMNEKGEYVVIVYWNSMEDAKASMDKFMTDASVEAFSSKIDAATMKMARYNINDEFDAENSTFTEVMSFNTKSDADLKAFNKMNKKVEKVFTSKQKGFVQRITGVDENGEQIVLVYWDNKANSDAALPLFMKSEISKKFMGMMDEMTVQMGRYEALTSIKNLPKNLSAKDKTIALLNSFNTGDQTPISYINPENYIQHNLAVADGLQGFGEVMEHAPPGGFKANIVRSFQDGDYVFTHTEYDFFGPKAGFDIFRFEDGLIVEHWDNLIDVQAPNPSNRTQFDGATEVTDLDKTEENKQLVRDFIEKVMLNNEMDKLTSYVNPTKYIQHNPSVADGLDGLGAAMKYFAEKGMVMEYTKLHMVLGEGNFVLAVSEGKFGKGEWTSYYDLFRIEDGLIVEHWDVIEPIMAKEKWKNNNGKF